MRKYARPVFVVWLVALSMEEVADTCKVSHGHWKKKMQSAACIENGVIRHDATSQGLLSGNGLEKV